MFYFAIYHIVDTLYLNFWSLESETKDKTKTKPRFNNVGIVKAFLLPKLYLSLNLPSCL